MQRQIIKAIGKSDYASGFALDRSGRICAPIVSIRLNPNATGFSVAIEFNHDISISAAVLDAAIVDEEMRVTIPGRAIFSLYHRVLVPIPR